MMRQLELGRESNISKEERIGETPSTPAGYCVKVSKVWFETGTPRIRLRLFRGDQFLHYFDLTSHIAKEVGRILRDLD